MGRERWKVLQLADLLSAGFASLPAMDAREALLRLQRLALILGDLDHFFPEDERDEDLASLIGEIRQRWLALASGGTARPVPPRLPSQLPAL
jgi:hypothetical protein